MLAQCSTAVCRPWAVAAASGSLSAGVHVLMPLRSRARQCLPTLVVCTSVCMRTHVCASVCVRS